MTKLTDVVAREHSVDLPEEAEAERHVGVAQARSRRGGVRHPYTRPEGSLTGALSSHDMPLEEIRAVLQARDPVVVARYMELHRERLAEQLAHRIRELEALERILARRSRAACRSDELSGEPASGGIGVNGLVKGHDDVVGGSGSGFGNTQRREGEMPKVIVEERMTHDEVVLALGREADPR